MHERRAAPTRAWCKKRTTSRGNREGGRCGRRASCTCTNRRAMSRVPFMTWTRSNAWTDRSRWRLKLLMVGTPCGRAFGTRRSWHGSRAVWLMPTAPSGASRPTRMRPEPPRMKRWRPHTDGVSWRPRPRGRTAALSSIAGFPPSSTTATWTGRRRATTSCRATCRRAGAAASPVLVLLVCSCP